MWINLFFSNQGQKFISRKYFLYLCRAIYFDISFKGTPAGQSIITFSSSPSRASRKTFDYFFIFWCSWNSMLKFWFLWEFRPAYMTSKSFLLPKNAHLMLWTSGKSWASSSRVNILELFSLSISEIYSSYLIYSSCTMTIYSTSFGIFI